MPEPEDDQGNFDHKPLSRRMSRSIRKSTLVKLSHVGVTLNRIDKEEREAHARAMNGCDNMEFCALIRAMDVIRERRRILLGIPLPSAATKRRLLDMPAATVSDAVLIPDSISQTVASEPVPPASS